MGEVVRDSLGVGSTRCTKPRCSSWGRQEGFPLPAESGGVWEFFLAHGKSPEGGEKLAPSGDNEDHMGAFLFNFLEYST